MKETGKNECKFKAVLTCGWKKERVSTKADKNRKKRELRGEKTDHKVQFNLR